MMLFRYEKQYPLRYRYTDRRCLKQPTLSFRKTVLFPKLPPWTRAKRRVGGAGDRFPRPYIIILRRAAQILQENKKQRQKIHPTWPFPPHPPSGSPAARTPLLLLSPFFGRTGLRLAALCSRRREEPAPLTWTALPATGIGFQPRTWILPLVWL